MSPIIGIHISKKKYKTLLLALVAEIKEYDINAAQIFVANPRSGKIIDDGWRHADKIKKFIEGHNIKLFVHTAYPTISVWNNNIYGFRILAAQMKLSMDYAAAGIILHLPRRTFAEVAEILSRYRPKLPNIPLLLELPAHKSLKNNYYERPKYLNVLTQKILKTKIKQWGYVIDTAHLKTAGAMIGSAAEANRWLMQLSKDTIQKIKLLHINGSHSDDGRDIHAIPIFGQKKQNGKIINDLLWGEYKHNIKMSGLYVFVRFAKKNKIPIILEVNAGTRAQLVKSLATIKCIS